MHGVFIDVLESSILTKHAGPLGSPAINIINLPTGLRGDDWQSSAKHRLVFHVFLPDRPCRPWDDNCNFQNEANFSGYIRLSASFY
jgi:hypothetical protein